MLSMAWDIEYTDEFEGWWETLTEGAQIDVDMVVGLLQECGPNLPFLYSSGVTGSRHSPMRELRIQHQGRPIRVLYAFDPHRTAILLLGGDKTGNNRWADRLYDEYLEELEQEGR
jgi:hypothetical protein